MKKLYLFIITLILMSFSPGDVYIGGVIMPNSYTVDSTVLKLNGVGIRSKFYIDIYVGGLYLIDKATDANKVLEEDKTMLLKFEVVSSLVSSVRMEEGTRKGFNNSLNGDTSKFSKEIEMFVEVFKGEIREGDVFDILYTPRKGSMVYKNNILMTTILGLEFKKALFGIWLSDNPSQVSLKDGLMGK